MSDQSKVRQFLKELKSRVLDYNEPSEIPRDAMWQRIHEARAKGAKENATTRVADPFWHSSRFALVAAAAVLILVIAIARFSSQDDHDGCADGMVTNRVEAPDRQARTRDLYRIAAAPVLDQVELLLTQFRTSAAGAGSGKSYSERAAVLLVDTRYLMSSPAMEDPKLRQLLSDLELILAQIVQLTRDSGEEAWVKKGMEGRRILPRLRAASKPDAGSNI